MAGWVPIPRDLLSDDLWLAEPFTRGQARIDLYGLARHAPGHVRLKGVRIDLQRGELAWSEQSLADRWRWSRGKVRRFLAELVAERMIVQRPNNVTSIIAVTNYDCQPTSSTTKVALIGTANGTAGNTANGTQKNKETIKQTHPPAPFVESTSPPDAWEEVEEMLRELGMSRAGEAIARARDRGLKTRDVVDMMGHWEKHCGAWGLGALFRRLTGDLADWPPVAASFERQQQRQATARSHEAVVAERHAGEQRREAEKRRRVALDDRWGAVIDALTGGEVVTALGDDAMLVGMYRRKGLCALVRERLGEVFELQEAVA